MVKQKGQVLLVVFMMLIMVSIIVGGTALLWQSSLSTAALEKDSLRAFYIAQAGVERGRAEIAVAENDSYGQPIVYFNLSSGGGFYNVTIYKQGNDKVINSMGRFGNSTRGIETQVEKGVNWHAHKKSKYFWKEQ